MPGAWVPVSEGKLAALLGYPDFSRDWLFNADMHTLDPKAGLLVHVSKHGDLELWHACNGCAPRKAIHGLLCEQCHLRLVGWLGNDEGSLAWAWDWIAPDLGPSQSAAMSGKISRGKPAPPAAISVHVLDLQSDITMALGRWLLDLAAQFGLHGPDWWRQRVDGSTARRAAAPQIYGEVHTAARYLVTWLDRIEGSDSLAGAMYVEAQSLMRRVEAVAPWQPKAQRLKGLACPECEREALVIFTGDEHLTCRRCTALVPRAKYDRWSALLEHEKEAVG